MKKFYGSIFYKVLKRVLTFFGDIYFATEPPKVKATNLRKMLELVQPGDILCRRYLYYLDSYFIKGTYSHSGVYIGNGEMVHAVAEGVSKIDVLDFTKDTDGFIILRPPYTSNNKEDSKSNLISYAIAQIGKPYDFIFNNKEVNAFYCHELSWNALKEGGFNIIPKGSIIYAEDLINYCKTIYVAP